jgi:hypothetical protein
MAKRMMLQAVDSLLTYAERGAVQQEQIEAFQYTTTFAQAVARKKSTDITSEPYFNALTHEYQVLGWNVIDATNAKVDLHASKISPAEVVSRVISPYLTGEQNAQLNGILAAIKQPSVGVTNFLTFWWNKARVHAGQTSLAMGPLFTMLGGPAITLVSYSFNFTANSWRALFVQRDTAALNVRAKYLKLNLNMALYRTIEEDIKKRLAGHEKEHIENVELDI